MRRAVWVAITLATLAACRGVVGIEDQSVDAGTTSSEAGAPKDGSAAETGIDAGPKPPPVPECQGKPNSGECIKCCRDRALQDVNKAFDDFLKADCACGAAGQCSSQCVNDLCAGNPPGAAGSTCNNCLTNATLAPACQPALDHCTANSACSVISICIEGTCK